jgi:hypothetical protein
LFEGEKLLSFEYPDRKGYFSPLNIQIEKVIEKKNNQKEYINIGSIVKAIPEF